jgi:hypothetical protein
MAESERRLRWKRQRRTAQALIAGAMVCAAAYLAVTFVPSLNRRAKAIAASRRSVGLAVPKKFSPTRPIYPYSIIRGGAYSRAELIDALDRDAVASRHYSGFHRSLVYTVPSAFTEPVYLSYRVGDAIYWTSQPVQLPRGETLLTDGHSYARARCGNIVSYKPRTPINDTEPGPEVFDTPQPLPGAIANLEIWTEDRLTTPEIPLFSQAPSVSPVVISAVSGLPIENGPDPFWLYTPTAGVLGLPITPNPITELIPPVRLPPFPPELWPPTPFSPIVPGPPSGSTVPPLYPTEAVPEPSLWIPILLACAAFGAARSRKN